jgi:hypothetical protein
MNIKKLIFLFFLAFSIRGFSQGIELSPLAKVSLLTVGTADDLSSKFGHTAIRIKDPAIDKDFVFGYGGFDFEDPLFYYKFTTGKLDYSMTAHRYTTFIDGYRYENRWVKEQSLNLSLDQRKKLFQFLQKNYRKENRNYKYDFLFDNCATKVPEVFDEIFDNSLNFDSSYIQKPSTFRQLIHETLDTNSWATFGIDLALGSVIDRKATAWEHQFLPFYVEKQFENTTIDGKPLVTKEELVLDAKPVSQTSNFFLSPLFWMIILLVLVVVRTYLDHHNNVRSKWLDFILFFLTGIAGILIAFLWFATDHSSTKMNFNILWAVAPNIIIGFYFLKKQPPKWISKYLILLLIFIGILVIFWFFKMQVFSPLMIFILAALGLRYLFLLRNLSPNKFPNIT